MKLYIVRHGQSERNVKLSGPFDCELTEVGVRQAELTGEWLRDKGIECLYCSPSVRTLQTATIVGRALSLTPKAWAPIVEWGYFFDEPGRTGAELRQAFPDADIDESFQDDRGWAADTTDESWSELYARAESVHADILSRHPVGSPTVCMVTHAHFARYLIGAMIGLARPDSDDWSAKIEHNNCGVTLFEFTPKATVLRYVNSHLHLGEHVTN